MDSIEPDQSLMPGLPKDVIREKGGSSKCCVIVKLDVINGLNSATWSPIQESLVKVGISAYLATIVHSFASRFTRTEDPTDPSPHGCPIGLRTGRTEPNLSVPVETMVVAHAPSRH